MRKSEQRVSKTPGGPVRLMYRMYKYILPETRGQLRAWRQTASEIPNPELRKQAIDSLKSKQFHCDGGSVYAAMDLSNRHVLIPLIVAFQTISDYLDNLCDRSTSLDPIDFRRLHDAMLDAMNPMAPVRNYYEFREESESNYLSKLVKTCQSCICLLPSYSLVQSKVLELVSYYCDLQVYKHIHRDEREAALLKWWEKHRQQHSELDWNEFAAATGSTLGVFMLLCAAANPNLDETEAQTIRQVYFPHICGLHILLDYLIDQEEDREEGDLNFCHYYDNMQTTVDRINWFVEQSQQELSRLKDPHFHRMIIEGLLALYLSDPKVKHQPEVRAASRKLMKNSNLMRLFFLMNSIWIRSKNNTLE